MKQEDSEPLRSRFRRAADVWLGNGPESQWQAESEWQTAWLGPRCALLEYARSCHGNLPAEDLDRLHKLLERDAGQRVARHYTEGLKDFPGLPVNFVPSCCSALAARKSGDATEVAARVPGPSTQQAEQASIAAQPVLLLHGLVHAVLAAGELRALGQREYESRRPELVSQALRSIAAYENAWSISQRRWNVPGTLNRPADSEALADLLQLAISELEHVSVPISDAGFLAFRRLLEYVLNDNREADCEFSTQVSVLSVNELKQDGHVGLLKAKLCREAALGCYLDPVALGLTLVDSQMIESLKSAFALNYEKLYGQIYAPGVQPPAVRLEPELPGLALLSGGSAGAVLSCGIFASAAKRELSKHGTASAGIADGKGNLSPVEERSVRDKLLAASKAGMTHVVLEASQAERHKAYGRSKGLTVHGAEHIEQVFKLLTRDAEMEQVLADYSDAKVEEWDRAWTDPENEDKLLYYVPPHFSLVWRRRIGSQAQSNAESSLSPGDELYPLEPVRGSHEEEVLANLLKRCGERLCMSEGPGAGKSIFTRRVLAFLSSQAGRLALFGDKNKPCLAVRWEEWSLDGRWPADFEKSLAEAVRSHCGREGAADSPAEVVTWALEHGRVVIILDALDQAEDVRIAAFHEFLAKIHRNNWHCRVIVTGRPFAVEQRRSSLFKSSAWRFGRIEPLDAEQQYLYLYGPVTAPQPHANDAWSRRNLSGVDVVRLVEAANLPGEDAVQAGMRANYVNSLQTLADGIDYPQVADLLSNSRTLAFVRRLAEDGELPAFRCRGDLYWRTHRHMLEQAAEKLLGQKPDDEEFIERLQEVLAATAFEMMVRNPGHFRLDGQTNVSALKREAKRRTSPDISGPDWSSLERISALTNRALLLGASDQVLAWPHRGMMEFYCGLHLARNTQANWFQPVGADGVSSMVACGDAKLRAHAPDPQWKEAFLHALEIPRLERQDDILKASLSELFRPPEASAPFRRPTELMYLAYNLLERELAGGQQVLNDFRRQFLHLVDQRHPVALQLLPDAELVKQGVLSDAESESRSAEERYFARCPPEESARPSNLTFPTCSATGAGHPIEHAQNAKLLKPFLMQTTPVTREQFMLFEPQYENAWRETLRGFDPNPRRRAIFVSWHDAWCFARWAGAALPTDMQWEFACRASASAGSTGICENQQANGGRPPVISKRSSQPGDDFSNPWGLLNMLNNVWEWCEDGEKTYRKQIESHSCSTVHASSRHDSRKSHRTIVDGWCVYANVRSSALRIRFQAVNRGVYFCFRLLYAGK